MDRHDGVGGSPASLVAILVAAIKAKDKSLEREVRRRLAEEHGIKLAFRADSPTGREREVSHV